MSFRTILYLLVSIIYAHAGDYQKFLLSTPTSFGLNILANFQLSQKQLFISQLNKYATMDCQDMTSISVIWTHAQLPQSLGVKISADRKRPVYFITNSRSRLSSAHQNEQKVYFSINYDSSVSCLDMAEAFLQWKSRAVGDIAPIMSSQMSGFDINLKKQKVTFNGKTSIFSFGMLEKSFIPSFFIHLYNSNRIWEATQIKEKIGQQIVCDDIALNYLVNYFFSQLVPIQLKTSFISERNIQNQQKDQVIRNQCLTRLILVLGYCPLRLVHRQDQNAENFKSTVSNYSIYLKRKQLQKILETKSLVQEKSQNIGEQIQRESTEKEKSKEKLKEQVQLIRMRLKSANEQKKRLQESIKKLKIYQPENSKEQVEIKNHKQAVSGLNSVINTIMDEGVAVFIILLLMIVYTVIKYLYGEQQQKQIKKRNEKKSRKQQSFGSNKFDDGYQIRIKSQSVN